MTDLKLSEFSEDQLRLMLLIVMKEMKEVATHIESLNKYESIASLMRDRIFECETELEDLRTLHVQFFNALKESEKQRIISSN